MYKTSLILRLCIFCNTNVLTPIMVVLVGNDVFEMFGSGENRSFIWFQMVKFWGLHQPYEKG